MKRSNCARKLVLFRGGRRRHRDVPDGQLELPGIKSVSGVEPVAGAELEVTLPGPVGYDSDHLGHVELGVEIVKLARSNEREDVGSRLGVVITSTEQPVFAPNCDGSQRSLRSVIFK